MKEKEVKDKQKSKNSSNTKWVVFVLFITFILSLVFAYISNTAIVKLDLIPAIIVLVLVVLLGITFDLIGVSVTIANEEDFHAQASKRLRGSKTAIKMIKNSARVSNFCADVIGDICGVLSGAISALIAFKLTEYYGMDSSLQFIISALVASITVSGKAITKEFAKRNSTKIITVVSKIIEI